ncbi:MAG: hypothetical protein CVV42_07915 [Candidatus Riflebacteria bacterium HGW-Riflebacteria-2]|jgi:hypothetical protein|nr:MAG: hypothetical protein CVV42_07915 [Candidatus Riflebacteria bacterium HGW-Riflebacteria-2]
MNFNQMMNWILGRSQPAQALLTAPAAARSVAHAERRISHRLSYSEGMVQIDGLGELPVKDLSQGGLSLNAKDLPEPASFQPEKVLSVRLLLGSVFFETDLRVSSVRGDEIGCAFVSMPFGHSRVLHDFLKPRLLAAGLREIRSTEANLRWFQSDEKTQILYWMRPEGGLEKADFYFMDYLISFDGKANSLRTGFVQTPFLGSSSHRAPGEGSIIYHETPSYRALKLGHIIFDHAALPEEIYIALGSIMFREEKCTFSRVILAEKDANITFEFTDESGPAVLRVVSLCATAISALLPDGPIKRKIPGGTILKGNLCLPDRKLSAVFKVVFQHDFIVGGGLKLENPGDVENLATFLTPRLLGKSLELVAPPSESKPFAPYGSRASLYVGIHNTHLLSLLTTDQLLYGRLVFSDRVILWDNGSLSAFSCAQGLVFPSDWDVVANTREQIPPDDPALLNTVREILRNSKVSQEILKAWEAILPHTPIA